MADSDVFSTPGTVSSCAGRNGGRDGEGLVSFARSLVRVISSMVIVIGRSSDMEWLLGAARRANVYICDKRQVEGQASCSQICARAPRMQGANQSRGTTSGDENIFC